MHTRDSVCTSAQALGRPPARRRLAPRGADERDGLHVLAGLAVEEPGHVRARDHLSEHPEHPKPCQTSLSTFRNPVSTDLNTETPHLAGPLDCSQSPESVVRPRQIAAHDTEATCRRCPLALMSSAREVAYSSVSLALCKSEGQRHWKALIAASSFVTRDCPAAGLTQDCSPGGVDTGMNRESAISRPKRIERIVQHSSNYVRIYY